jgi:menaquinol-cytochrome c reductase iron-sulfur subunit
VARSTRGRFLKTATVGLGATTTAVTATPVAAYVLAPVRSEARFRPTPLGPIDRFTGETGFAPTAVTYAGDPANPLSAGLAYVHHTGGTSRDWQAREAMFVVFSNRCMHVGCPVQATGIGFACPCHGGQYDRLGRRTAGPPIRPLDRFQWEIRSGDVLWITRRWSVAIDAARSVSYHPVRGPGQALDALYPAVTYS